MNWEKKSIICDSNSFGLHWYIKNTMVPVPYLLSAEKLRIFIAMCDEDNVGRIGFVDVNPENPSQVLGYSKTPVLDVGSKDCFDNHGVLPSAIFVEGENAYMLYSSNQRQENGA